MGLPDWNPNAPGKRGIEHLDVGYGHTVIDAASDVGELQWEVARTGDLDTIELYAGIGASAPVLGGGYGTQPRPMLVDLVEQGDEAWGPITHNDFSVSAVTGGTGMFNENLSTPITPSRLNAFDDGLFIASSTLNAFFDAQFTTGAFGLDRHVLAVEPFFRGNITLRVTRYDPAGALWARDFPFWSSGFVGGSVRWGEAIVQHSASAWSHWTPQMIRDFASGGTRKIRITCRAGPGSWRIDRLYLRVWSIPERRRGVGIGSPTSSLLWVPFDMATPNATGSPAVVAGEDMTLMARRITDYSVDAVASAVLPWRFMRGRSTTGDWRNHQQTFRPAFTSGLPGTGSILMDPAGPQIDGIPAARMLDGATVIDDTMPYNLSRGAVCWGTNTVSQFLTMAGGPTIYGQAFAVAGWVPTLGRPIAPLRAEVYDSGGVKILDAVEVTAADVDRLPVSAPVSNTDDTNAVYKTVQFRFPNSEQLLAAQYELRLSSPASTEDRPWRIAALMADVHADDQTFGADVDYADGFFPSGTTLHALTDAELSSDVLAQLVEVPAAVTGVGTSNGSLTAHHVEICSGESGCEGCAEDTMPYVQLTWSAAPSGTPDVAAYHVDRMDDLSPDWERVALVHGRLNTVWNDHEARIGVRSSYRVRVVREDLVTGDWSDPISETVPGGQVALAFSSNAATGMGCVYPEVWTGEVNRDWSFLEAADVELRRIYGRNRQVAFRPLERRGDGFSRTVLLSFGCTVALPTMDLFAPLRDLGWAPVPYVCVRDGEGNRWLASLTVPEGRNRRADDRGTEMWLSEIGIVEVADTPSVHDTSVAQVAGVPSL